MVGETGVAVLRHVEGLRRTDTPNPPEEKVLDGSPLCATDGDRTGLPQDYTPHTSLETRTRQKCPSRDSNSRLGP